MFSSLSSALGQTKLFSFFNVSTNHIFSVFGSSFVVLILSQTNINGMPQSHKEIWRHYILALSLQFPKASESLISGIILLLLYYCYFKDYFNSLI